MAQIRNDLRAPLIEAWRGGRSIPLPERIDEDAAGRFRSATISTRRFSNSMLLWAGKTPITETLIAGAKTEHKAFVERATMAELEVGWPRPFSAEKTRRIAESWKTASGIFQISRKKWA